MRFKSLQIRVVLLLCFVLIRSSFTNAADRYFTNSVSGDFTNKTLWMTGVVPVNADKAFFTNNVDHQINFTMNITNAGAYFNNTIDTTWTQSMGTATWFITNQFAIATNTAFTSQVVLVSGNLVVTNAGGTAQILVGGSGFGRLTITNGTTVIADHVYSTNGVNSRVSLDGGTLTILDDSIFETNILSSALSMNQKSTLNILGGATIFGSNLTVGAGSTMSNVVNVSGSSTWVSNRIITVVGSGGDYNEVWVSNGAHWYNGREILLGLGGGNSNKFVVMGSGTTLTSAQEVTVGYTTAGSFNQFIVSNGAEARIFQLINGNTGTSNQTYITSGGKLYTGVSSHAANSGSNSVLVVTGSGSLMANQATFTIGNNSTSINNYWLIEDGAVVSNGATIIGNSGASNTVVVRDAGSYFTNCGGLLIGQDSSGNILIISNGGRAYADEIDLGSNATATGNKIVINGAGSIMSAIQLQVGSNDLGLFGKGLIYVTNGGTLEIRTAVTNGYSGFGNISNIGGIYQFTSAKPTVETNAGGTIYMTNGAISYRNVQNAPVLITNQLSKFSLFGSNTYMLNNSTNAILSSYTFTNGFTGTNYAHLTLVNGASRWQATNTLIGATSRMLVSNTAGSTFGTITNAGTLQMAGAGTTLTNEGNLIIIGNGAGGAGSIVNLVGTNTISGPLLLGGNSTIGTEDDYLTLKGTLTNNSFQVTVTNTGGSTLEISSSIQGSGGVVHNGTGTLVLSGVNSAFSGTITNNAGGTIVSASSTGLGTGNLVMNGGFLTFTNANQDYDQTFTFNNAVTQTVASGIVVTMGRNANDITGSGLIVKQGAGELVITNHVTQDASGGWRIDDGRVTIEVKGALGTGTITMNGGELRQYVSSFTLDNAFSVTADSMISVTNGSDLTLSSSSISATAGTTLTLNEVAAVQHSGSIIFLGSNFTYAGNIDLSDSGLQLIFGGASPGATDPNGIAATNIVSGTISDLGGNTFSQAAVAVRTNITLVLSGTNTYAGTTRIFEGTLLAVTNNALGTTTGATAVTNNGTLGFLSNVNYSTAESIVLSSTGGVRGVGLVGVSGTNRFAGYITNANDSSIGTWAGNLTLSGGLDMMGHSLVITNAANSVLTNSGIIVGSGPITHNGSGTVVFTGLNTFSGAVTNNGGTFEINSPTGLGVTTSVVLNGGTLLFKGSLTNTSAAVVLNGGVISELDTNVSLGAMTVTANSQISLGSGGAAGRLTFASGTNTVGSGAKLTVYGWSWNSALSGGSDDLIFFTSTSFETASFLNNVTFFGTGGGARVLSSGELVPITPEPTTITGAFILLGLLTKRLLRFKQWSNPPKL